MRCLPARRAVAPNNEDGAIAAVADAKNYAQQPTNSYAAVMHANTKKYDCHAFPFDDACGYSSDLSDPSPVALNATLGSFA